jgi:hypothetical protein
MNMPWEGGTPEEQQMMDQMGQDIGRLIKTYVDDNERDLYVLRSRTYCLMTVFALAHKVMTAGYTNLGRWIQDREASQQPPQQP